MAITGEASYSTARTGLRPHGLGLPEGHTARDPGHGQRRAPPDRAGRAGQAALPPGQGSLRQDPGASARRSRPTSPVWPAKLAKRARSRGGSKGRNNLKRSQGRASHFRSVRSFNLTWSELDGWTEMYDVDELAARLTRRGLAAIRAGRHRDHRVPRPAHRRAPPHDDIGVVDAPTRRPCRPSPESRCRTSPAARSCSSSPVPSPS